MPAMIQPAEAKRIFSIYKSLGSSVAAAEQLGVGHSTVLRHVEAHKAYTLGKPLIKKHRTRVVACGDMHCGAKSGLTPPVWWYPIEPDMSPERRMWAELQRETWEQYTAWLEALQPIDVLIVNGDCIDGPGRRSGGTELITPSMTEQAEIAATCIREARARRVYITHGTPYHTALDGEDVEAIIAREVGGSVHDHLWLDVDGVVFDVKHKVGSSGIPHGRNTAVNKEKLWNDLWAEIGGAPKADVFLRSHVHYYRKSEDPTYMAMTLPALQAPLTKYGARQCSGVVHWGVVYFDVYTGTGPALRRVEANTLIRYLQACAPVLVRA